MLVQMADEGAKRPLGVFICKYRREKSARRSNRHAELLTAHLYTGRRERIVGRERDDTPVLSTVLREVQISSEPRKVSSGEGDGSLSSPVIRRVRRTTQDVVPLEDVGLVRPGPDERGR